MLALARPHSRVFVRALALSIAGLALAGCGINTIPTLQERAKAAWSEVLNQYQRRADLIPNLVETVKGYAAQESKVLTDVVEARAKATQVTLPPDVLTNPEAFKKFQEAQGQLTGALARLLAVVESYPQLKANEQFNRLMDDLSGTENRIAVARMRYNEAIQTYNTSRRRFPANITARLFGFKEYPFFEAPPEAQKAPKVNFTQP